MVELLWLPVCFSVHLASSVKGDTIRGEFFFLLRWFFLEGTWCVEKQIWSHKCCLPCKKKKIVEIDHEIFSTVILSLPLIEEGQLSVSDESAHNTGLLLRELSLPSKVWLGKLTVLYMTTLCWLGRKTSTQKKKKKKKENGRKATKYIEFSYWSLCVVQLRFKDPLVLKMWGGIKCLSPSHAVTASYFWNHFRYFTFFFFFFFFFSYFFFFFFFASSYIIGIDAVFIVQIFYEVKKKIMKTLNILRSWCCM